ncbi:hypothetical protein Esti_001060 [Eimeria stiedai]
MKGLAVLHLILLALLGVQQSEGASRLVLSAMRRAPQAISAARGGVLSQGPNANQLRIVCEVLKGCVTAFTLCAPAVASTVRQHIHKGQSFSVKAAAQQVRSHAAALYNRAESMFRHPQGSNALQQTAAERILAIAIGPTAAGVVAAPLLSKLLWVITRNGGPWNDRICSCFGTLFFAKRASEFSFQMPSGEFLDYEFVFLGSHLFEGREPMPDRIDHAKEG